MVGGWTGVKAFHGLVPWPERSHTASAQLAPLRHVYCCCCRLRRSHAARAWPHSPGAFAAPFLAGALGSKGAEAGAALEQQLLQEDINLAGRQEEQEGLGFNWADFGLLARAYR